MTTAPAPTAMLDAALGYATRGWFVFPVYGKLPAIPSAHPDGDPLRGTCRGTCGEPGHGYLDATTDEATVRRWWSRPRVPNIGIACGASRLLVIDVDPRHGGDASLAELERQHGPLPDTPRSLTGGGGTHYYFRPSLGRDRYPAHLAQGVDIKANGGCIVAPPSVHPETGKSYMWDAGAHPEDVPLADPPAWVEDVVRQPSPNTNGKVSAYQLIVQPILEHSRDTSLTRVAGWLHLYHPAPVVEQLLLVINTARCVPPLPESEVRKIARSIDRYPLPGPLGHPRAVKLGTWTRTEERGRPVWKR